MRTKLLGEMGNRDALRQEGGFSVGFFRWNKTSNRMMVIRDGRVVYVFVAGDYLSISVDIHRESTILCDFSRVYSRILWRREICSSPSLLQVRSKGGDK